MRKWTFGIFLVLAVLVFSPEWISVVGVLGLIPCTIVSIYGTVSLMNETNKALKENGLDSEKDIIRLYQEKHPLLEEYRPLAMACRRNVDKVTRIYALGIIAVICVLIFMTNVWVLFAAVFFFTYAFNILARYRASSFIPITALLYEKCDPIACASAIIFYSYNHNRFKLRDHVLLAQCLVYMDDPELAKKVLCTYPLKDAASTLSYYSVLSYIYYVLKEDVKLQECKTEASKIRMNYGNMGVSIQSQELISIQNKIDLMDGKLNSCRKYYLMAYQGAKFLFQKVDAAYYIGLISFVEEDYVVAQTYLEKVIQIGNNMHFVKKAEHYLSKITEMNIMQDAQDEMN